MDDDATVPGGARGDLRCPTASALRIPKERKGVPLVPIAGTFLYTFFFVVSVETGEQ